MAETTEQGCGGDSFLEATTIIVEDSAYQIANLLFDRGDIDGTGLS